LRDRIFSYMSAVALALENNNRSLLTLCEPRLVKLVVTPATVANKVDDNVLPEHGAVLVRDIDSAHNS
jgi:hypothetical protein